VAGQLIVRRVERRNPEAPGQDGLFDVRRHHAVSVTSTVEMLQAESQHRGCARPSPRAAGDALPEAAPGLVRRRDTPAVQPMVLTAAGSGPGIPSGPLPRLLRRFTRAGTSRSVAAADDGACW
jgi:hypothetical protein